MTPTPVAGPPQTFDQKVNARLAAIEERLDRQHSEAARQAEEIMLLRDHLNDAQLWLHRLLNGTVGAPVSED